MLLALQPGPLILLFRECIGINPKPRFLIPGPLPVIAITVDVVVNSLALLEAVAQAALVALTISEDVDAVAVELVVESVT